MDGIRDIGGADKLHAGIIGGKRVSKMTPAEFMECPDGKDAYTLSNPPLGTI